MTLFLALLSSAPAAQIEVTIGGIPGRLLVDGQDAPYDDAAQMYVVGDLPAGKHSVETRTLGGKTSAWKEFELAADDRIRFEYRKKELWEVGTWKLQGAAPVAIPQPVAQPVAIAVQPPVTDSVVIDIAVPGMSMKVTETNSVAVGIDIREEYPGDQWHEPVPPPTRVVRNAPMPASRFAGLLSTLEAASFSDEKLATVTAAGRSNQFSCAQVAQVMGTFNMSSDKVEAVRVLRPSIVDPDNAFMLTDNVPHSSDRTTILGLFQ